MVYIVVERFYSGNIAEILGVFDSSKRARAYVEHICKDKPKAWKVQDMWDKYSIIPKEVKGV